MRQETNAIPLYSAERAEAAVDIGAALSRVVRSHRYILGSEVADFEGEFARYCGAAHAVAVGNGTDALEIALRVLGVGPSDVVLVAANAGFYGSAAAYAVGAAPGYVEIDAGSHTMAADALAEQLTGGASAVIVTHLYGQLADVQAILEVCGRAGVPVIEDCAQAHGSSRDGRRAGTFGAIGCFSFYPTKNLGAAGDGGALVTNDEMLAARARALRQYGWAAKYTVEMHGGRNSRLDELQAAVLRVKLPHLDSWNAERRAIAQRYIHGLGGLPVTTPSSIGDDYVAHLFVIAAPNRDGLRSALAADGIATDVHYPIPDHRQKVHAGKDMPSLPVTEWASGSVVSLPCFPGLTTEEVDRVIAAVRRYYVDRPDS